MEAMKQQIAGEKRVRRSGFTKTVGSIEILDCVRGVDGRGGIFDGIGRGGGRRNGGNGGGGTMIVGGGAGGSS